MKIEFIKGGDHFITLNGTYINGEIDLPDRAITGRFIIDYEWDENRKMINKKKTIRIYKQDKWYLNILMLIHELGHWFIDLFFPSDESVINLKQQLVEKYLDLNKLPFIFFNIKLAPSSSFLT